MVKVLLIGNGAREHAIADAVKRSPQKPLLYSFLKAKNPGIVAQSEEYQIGKYDDLEAIKDFAKRVKPDFAVIGPEDPLAKGVVDALEEVDVKSVGPKKELAKLESSKSFTRDLLAKHNIPGNAKFKIFTSIEGIKEFMEELNGNFVVKADGLKGGKGVKVVGDHLEGIDDGLKYCGECIKQDGKVVVEEKLEGEEFSLMSFVDGKTVKDIPPVQDHKRAFVDDRGPNTGGMGSYSDANLLLPFLTEDDLKKAHDINQKVCNALLKETGKPFKGIMYGGFIAVKDGVRLIEYNVRFGDPEGMNVLPLLKTDFVDVCKAIIDGTLDKLEIEFHPKATVCKYVVPEGYPDEPLANEKVDLSKMSKEANVYYASVDQKEDGLYMTTSRAIAFVGIADTLEIAEQIAEGAALSVDGRVFHRHDIGKTDLVTKRVKHMQELRGDKK